MIISEERNSLPDRKNLISGLSREFFMVSAEYPYIPHIYLRQVTFHMHRKRPAKFRTVDLC